MKSEESQRPARPSHLKMATTLLAGLLFALAGCGGDDPSPTASSTTPAASLSSETLATPLTPEGNDRFLTVISTIGDRFYAVGFDTVNGDSRMALARIGQRGGLDGSFGQNGVARINVAPGGKTAELARGVAVLSTGKIVIAGPVEHDPTASGDAARDTDVALLRFDANGQLDPTFGTNGIARLDFGPGTAISSTAFRGDTSWGLTLLPGDDLLLVGGKLADGPGRKDIDYVVAKLEPTGQLDPSFGQGGVVTLDVDNGNDNPRTAILQPDGKIVVSGHTADAAGVITTVLFRLSPTGQLDSTFGKNGVVNEKLLPSIAEAYDVAFQGQNLVIAGYGKVNAADTVDIISARFLPNGTWDKSYGTNGVTMIDLAGQDDRSRKLEVLPDGRVVIVGQGKPTATTQNGALVLLTANGQRDTTLNRNGVALFDFGGTTDALFGLALSADKKSAVLVGWKGVDTSAASTTNNDDARIVRIAIPGAP